MFLINQSLAHRTLFHRIGSFTDIEFKTQIKKKDQPKFTFVELEDSKEEPKKESFTNDVEANAVADLLAAFDIDLQTCAVTTPYRT